MEISNLADEAELLYMDRLQNKLNTMWVIICSVSVILSQSGYMMKETGTIKMKNNNLMLLKTILVVSSSALSFFLIGYGFSQDANGGLLGQEKYFGL
jgi:ammonium transporter, Amt family